VGSPPQQQTLAFLLDHLWTGGLIVAVDHTHLPEHLLGVVEVMSIAGSRTPPATALVVATVRPEHDVLEHDTALWWQASQTAARHGIELVEWFVVGPTGFHCPRELAGDATRWPT